MLMTKYSTTDSLVDLLHAQGNTRKFQNHTNSQAEIIPKSQAEITGSSKITLIGRDHSSKITLNSQA